MTSIGEYILLWNFSYYVCGFCRQCVSLWESLSGRHTIVPMTISLLGTYVWILKLQKQCLCSMRSFSDSRLPFHCPLYSLVPIDLMELSHEFRKEYVERIINRGGNQAVEARWVYTSVSACLPVARWKPSCRSSLSVYQHLCMFASSLPVALHPRSTAE